MIRIIHLLLMFFTSVIVLAQKSIQVPSNKRDMRFYERLPSTLDEYGLEDLTKTNDSLSLRVWRSNKIIEVKKQGEATHASLTFWINQQEPIVRKNEFGQEVSQKLLDSLLANNIMSLPGNPYYGVDGSYITIEVATPERYRMYSYWSPGSSPSPKNEGAKEVVRMMALANDILDESGHISAFIESLEPGGYTWGMTGFRVDRFLHDDAPKSSLYKTVEERVKRELNVTPETSHRNYPMVIINHKPALLQDLNKYKNSDVKSLEIITKENPKQRIYGTSGLNGIIMVETK